MKDTPPDVERMYREMLLDRSRADRLKMGCSMFATARAFVLASARRADPTVSPAALRRALFLRVYGSDFDAVERARIAARLEAEASEPDRSRLRVPVDWDLLEAALTSNAGECACYLDVRTGEVLMIPADHFDDDGDWPSQDEIEAGRASGRLLRVEPLGSDLEYGWMAAFASSVGDRRLRDRLEAALHGHGVFRRFKRVVQEHPEARQRWLAFCQDRLHQAARDWLAEHEIEATTAPRASR